MPKARKTETASALESLEDETLLSSVAHLTQILKTELQLNDFNERRTVENLLSGAMKVSFAGKGDDEEMEEEKRVLYVAATRAIEHLYLLSYENEKPGSFADPLLSILDDKTSSERSTRFSQPDSGAEEPSIIGYVHLTLYLALDYTTAVRGRFYFLISLNALITMWVTAAITSLFGAASSLLCVK